MSVADSLTMDQILTPYLSGLMRSAEKDEKTFAILLLTGLLVGFLIITVFFYRDYWKRKQEERKENNAKEKDLREFQAAEKEKELQRADRERKEDAQSRKEFAASIAAQFETAITRLESSIKGLQDELKRETGAINGILKDHGDRILRLELKGTKTPTE